MYYQLDWKEIPSDPDLANTDTCPDVDVAWTMGVFHDEDVEEPIVCPLNKKRGRKMRDLFLTDIPLFSTKLVSALENAGVDNLQKFKAEIIGFDNEIYHNYFAVNIVGLIACADLNESKYLPDTEPPLMSFSRLVIDERKAHGINMFRLAEDSLHILISEDVKRRLDIEHFVGLNLIPIQSKH